MFGRILLITFIFCGILQVFSQTKVKKLTIGLNASGDILITKADGKRIGFDSNNKRAFNEIRDSLISQSTSGNPLYHIPISDKEKNLTIKVFGNTPNTKGNLSITGDGFVIRLIGLELEPSKVLTISLKPNGQKLEFYSNQAEEMLKFNFAIDPPDGKEPSYLFKIERTKLFAAKKISLNLDIGNGTFDFIDDSPPIGNYSLNLTRINLDGTQNEFSKSEITSKKANIFQLDFKKWDQICLRNGENKKGFSKSKCQPLK
ncbi:MAG: hypothetical protein K1X72_15875 [Pyrinomonadaceae bacterium]|nr:hypothetical protein [Pyrinomonadaceae bacterium]